MVLNAPGRTGYYDVVNLFPTEREKKWSGRRNEHSNIQSNRRFCDDSRDFLTCIRNGSCDLTRTREQRGWQPQISVLPTGKRRPESAEQLASPSSLTEKRPALRVHVRGVECMGREVPPLPTNEDRRQGLAKWIGTIVATRTVTGAAPLDRLVRVIV